MPDQAIDRQKYRRRQRGDDGHSQAAHCVGNHENQRWNCGHDGARPAAHRIEDLLAGLLT